MFNPTRFHFGKMLFLLICLSTSAVLSAVNPWVARHNLSAAQYQQFYNTYTQQGYRPKQVSCYTAGNSIFYAALFEKVAGPAYVTHHGMSAADYQQKFTTYTQQGYRLTWVDGCGLNGAAYYSAIWEKNNAIQIARHGMSAAQYQQEYNTQNQNGYRIKQVEGFGVGNAIQFVAFWEKTTGPALIARHNLTAAQYQQEFNTNTQNGYRPTHVSGYNQGATDYYACIFEKVGGPAWSARHRMDSKNYQAEFDNHFYQGYYPVLVNGYSDGASARFTAIWEKTPESISIAGIQHIDKTVGAYINKYGLPGAGVGIVKDGRLIFAKGYGFADKSTGELASPTDLFRVASVSKPLTGVAIMKLVEQNKLKLSDKVFGNGSILGFAYGQTLSNWETQITVQHLLEHTAGGTNWDNNGDDGVGDPMFSNPTMTQAQLITTILAQRDPSHVPGTKYAYSNFGYCILGRIIEKVTGQGYEAFVKNNILAPCGVNDMHIGGDTKAQKRHNEVVYHDLGGGDPYTMKVTRMDAHGGWIASPVDFLRLLVRVDGFPTKPDIISPASFATMVTKSAVSNYAKGWNVNGSNYFHMGSLPGTGTVMVRAGNGLSWVFFTNGKSDADAFFGDMDKLMWDVVNGIPAWPANDLF